MPNLFKTAQKAVVRFIIPVSLIRDYPVNLKITVPRIKIIIIQTVRAVQSITPDIFKITVQRRQLRQILSAIRRQIWAVRFTITIRAQEIVAE